MRHSSKIKIPDFPKLYKKTSTGAIQEWEISIAVVPPNKLKSLEAEIFIRYGQVDGKKQLTSDIVNKGKNIGKANETSVVEQAIADAKGKWDKQKKKGYVEQLSDAQVGKVDAVIKGGISPMLAHKFRDQSHKIKFPAFGQPKLDGHRCIAIIDREGKCSLWGRTRKEITSMVHISRAVERNLEGKRNLVLDGELYNHEYKSRFEELTSAIRKEEPPENYDIVQYHIYDCVNSDPFVLRFKYLEGIIHDTTHIKLVETKVLEDELKVVEYYKECVKRGYEGAMVRNFESDYVSKRSYDLQKVKQFDDAEFKILGCEEGSGKLRGHVGSFICETSNKKVFNVKMSGDTGMLKSYFEDHSLWEGQILTVQFQGLTGKERVPRFPVGLRLRKSI